MDISYKVPSFIKYIFTVNYAVSKMVLASYVGIYMLEWSPIEVDLDSFVEFLFKCFHSR